MKIDELTEDQIKNIRKAFKMFEENNDGYLPTKQLGNALRWLKLIPSEDDINTFQEILDPDKTGSLTWDRFLVAAAELSFATPQQLNSYLWHAFIVFDPDLKGIIPAEQMREILTKLGTEPIPEKEADKLIKRFVNPHHQVEYSFMINELMR
ncbi:Centrin-2 [Fasciolopsis buskii]|uniref:Centrin-2 n=1 Tax=Fasciolopsis buskii TaxID=27845 RepID=A0A8E0VP07_9TREM|nr:Centrin-2 [Fasciolopsis buski]